MLSSIPDKQHDAVVGAGAVSQEEVDLLYEVRALLLPDCVALVTVVSLKILNTNKDGLVERSDFLEEVVDASSNIA